MATGLTATQGELVPLPADAATALAVREELERLLASRHFRSSKHYTSLLRHVVEHALQGASITSRNALDVPRAVAEYPRNGEFAGDCHGRRFRIATSPSQVAEHFFQNRTFSLHSSTPLLGLNIRQYSTQARTSPLIISLHPENIPHQQGLAGERNDNVKKRILSPVKG